MKSLGLEEVRMIPVPQLNPTHHVGNCGEQGQWELSEQSEGSSPCHTEGQPMHSHLGLDDRRYSGQRLK